MGLFRILAAVWILHERRSNTLESFNKGIKLSVIIPVYNTASYLPECLQSVQKQTLREIEIICVNDGSTDESLSVLREFCEKDFIE